METISSIPSVDLVKHGAEEAMEIITQMPTTWFTAIIVGILVILLVRRIFRKRLKLPPGPRNLPIIGAMLSLDKEMHKGLVEQAKKHGPLVYFRLGSHSMLAIQSAEIAEELFKQKDGQFASRAHSTILFSLAKYFGFDSKNMGFAPYTQRLKQLRKVCTKELLTIPKLSATEYVRWEEQGEMIKEVESLDGKDFELREVLHTVAMNVTCRMLFGKRYYGKNVAITKELTEFQELMEDMIAIAGKPNVGDIIPWLRWLDLQGMTKQFKKLHDKQEHVLRNILEDHKMAKKTSANRLASPATMDFVDVLLSLRGEDQLPDDTIMATVSDIMMGATDSTLTVVQWAIIELMRHPESMAKLQKELDDFVGKNRALRESDFSQIPYLMAVVKETLRLHPPVPLLIPRMNEKQTTLHGYDIPENTTVFVNVWAISRDESNWEKADQFIPERFLDSTVSVNGNDFKYTPFGAGRRQCVGISMGLIMVDRTLGSLIHAFDWLPASGKQVADIDNEETYSLVLEPKHPLVCRAVPRLPKVDVYYDPRYVP
ncbi:hypothetical protein R1flu_005739 [Riccia fluitans]|uniref:Cytochrome P450 n=1 Tax=Riccia fluitans TaxID=41844 RepID=A0ABD1YU99_9MARC